MKFKTNPFFPVNFKKFLIRTDKLSFYQNWITIKERIFTIRSVEQQSNASVSVLGSSFTVWVEALGPGWARTSSPPWFGKSVRLKIWKQYI